MRWAAVGLVLLVLFGLCVYPAMAATGERYSYITVKNISIHLEDEHATITIDYSIDGGIQLLVMLLGKSDLKRKVVSAVNYESATVQEIDLERAVIFVKRAAYDYGDGAYWYPVHQFNVVTPNLTIITPQNTRYYQRVNATPTGIGYFRP
jgi:hypothetical protein